MTKKEYLRENSVIVIFEGHKSGFSNEELSTITGIPTYEVEKVLHYTKQYEGTKPKKLNLLRFHENYTLLQKLQAEVLA